MQLIQKVIEGVEVNACPVQGKTFLCDHGRADRGIIPLSEHNFIIRGRESPTRGPESRHGGRLRQSKYLESLL